MANDFLGPFIDFSVKIAIKIAPDFFSDPVHQQFLILVVVVMGLTLGVQLFIFAFKGIKDPARRLKFFVLATVVITNIIFLNIVTNRENAPFSYGDVIAIAVLNLLFFGIYKLPKIFKKYDMPGSTNLNSDLVLKNQGSTVQVMLCCPGCGAKTISKSHAMRVPQTCGECHRRYKVKYGKAWSAILSVFLLGSLFASFYLAIANIISKNTCLILILVIMVMFVVAATVFIKLEEVK